MDESKVLGIYEKLAAVNIPVWIDGGWCVDALLGKQTREHPGLDIAVDRKHSSRLKELLLSWGYIERPSSDSTKWNYVMNDDHGSVIDIHVFEFDDQNNKTYGIQYPRDSLAGKGTIAGKTVQCITPEWMFKFKTSYIPQEKDRRDVHALGKKFGFEVPAIHR